MARRPLSWRSGIDIGRFGPIWASGGRRESEQPLHVVGHGHEVPFAADLFEAAQQELPEPQHRLLELDSAFYELSNRLRKKGARWRNTEARERLIRDTRDRRKKDSPSRAIQFFFADRCASERARPTFSAPC